MATRQHRQLHTALYKKLESCEDELSQLLDQIYKFPHLQRQKFYDRIQLLRHNLNQLKISVRDNQHSFNMPYASLEKRYQQIFLKLTDLKSQISATQLPMPQKNKPKKGLEDPSESHSHNQSLTGNHMKGSKAGKSEYDAIMETIVQKDEEARRYRVELEACRSRIKDYELQEDQTRKLMEELQKEIFQIQIANRKGVDRVKGLEGSLLELQETNHALEMLCHQFQNKNEQNSQEISRLESVVGEYAIKYDSKKVEAEQFGLEFASLSQKYKYDMRMHMQMQQKYKAKQRHQEVKIKELERKLSEKEDYEQANRELSTQNDRLKEDIKVMEAELSKKQEHLFEKSKVIEAKKIEADIIEAKVRELEKCAQVQNNQIQSLLGIERENQNVILMLERKSKDMEKFIAQLQQQKLLTDKRCRVLEQDLARTLKRSSDQKQTICKLQMQVRKKEENLVRITTERQRLEREIERSSLEIGRTDKKCEEMSRIMGHLEQAKKQLTVSIESRNEEIKVREEVCKAHEKEIQMLKKRVMRAKIESIHNLRELLG